MAIRIIAQRYRLLQEISPHGPAQVYLTEDIKSPGPPLVLKFIPLKKSTDATFLDSLKNEFHTLTQLKNVNLAEVYDFGMTEKHFYLTSQWIEGRDLYQATRDTHLNTIFQLFVQVLRAVHYLHRRGVLHLDLKPENILVTDPNQTGRLTVKIIDFGLARGLTSRNTQEEEFSGTPPYAAPEMLRGEAIGPPSDLYALGMIFHRILTDQFPFSSQDVETILLEQVGKHRLEIGELPPALSEDFKNLLRDMLQVDPQDRYPNVSQILNALNRSLGENFTLRSPSAPVDILGETDFSFRKNIFEEIRTRHHREESNISLLSGAPGSGKTYLLRRLKENLQLAGRHPLFLDNWETLGEILSQANKVTYPILLDHPFENWKELEPWVQKLLNQNMEAIVISPPPPPDLSPPLRPFSLNPIPGDSIQEFFGDEIDQLPETSRENLASLSEGNPGKLEILLRALKEKGVLQWSPHGWQWMSELSLDLTDLESYYHALWKNRLDKAQEILKFSGGEWDAATLEGLLGLEPGALQENLEHWARSGRLRVHRKGINPTYSLPQDRESPQEPALPQDWAWVRQKLESLYERGQYPSGILWVEALQRKFPDPEKLPVDIRLLGSRHLVAAGLAQRALDFLPGDPSPGASGIYFEIQARAYQGLRLADKTSSAANRAMIAYQNSKDHGGMARMHNFRAFQLKTQGKGKPAEGLFKTALAEARLAQNNLLQASFTMNLANYYQDCGKLGEAEQYYRQAREFFLSQSHPLFYCRLLHNWVNFQFHTGQSRQAEKTCYEWLNLSLQNHFLEQQAMAFSYLALLANQSGNHQAQREYLNQAIAWLQSLPALQSPHLLPQIQLNRAYLFFELRDYLPAQLDGEAALDLASRYSHAYLMAGSHLLLGKVLRDRSRADLSEAEEHFKKSAGLIRENQFRHMLWELEFEKGLFEKARGNLQSAQDHFGRAEHAINLLTQDMPEAYKNEFLRDRKLEKIQKELRETT